MYCIKKFIIYNDFQKINLTFSSRLPKNVNAQTTNKPVYFEIPLFAGILSVWWADMSLIIKAAWPIL